MLHPDWILLSCLAGRIATNIVALVQSNDIQAANIKGNETLFQGGIHMRTHAQAVEAELKNGRLAMLGFTTLLGLSAM